MEQHVAKRTGQPPLRFEGEQLAEISGRWQDGRELNRGHDLVVYRTAAGKIILSIHYWSQWQGESEQWTAAVVDRVADVSAELLEHDPLGFLPPAHPSQSDRWARTEADIERAYQVRVTELLDALGIDAAEVVP